MKPDAWASYQAALPPEARAGGEPDDDRVEAASAAKRAGPIPGPAVGRAYRVGVGAEEMTERGDSIRVEHPLFQTGGGGSQPTSPLQLWVHRIMPDKAKSLNALWHSRLPRIGDPMSVLYAGVHFAATFEGVHYAVAMWTHPVNRTLPQDWLELRRLAIAPDAPRNTASRMLAVMARLIRRDCPSVPRLISYQDTEVHTGCIYRAAGWELDPIEGKSRCWDTPGRRRPKSQSTAPKRRWSKVPHG